MFTIHRVKYNGGQEWYIGKAEDKEALKTVARNLYCAAGTSFVVRAEDGHQVFRRFERPKARGAAAARF